MALGRRSFLQLLAAGAAGCAARPSSPIARVAGATAATATPAAKPLRILILGGTGFIGPVLVRLARARGHTITLFNRGKTNPHLFPDVETILGDRRTDIDRLKGRDWDAVIDTWVMLPASVRAAAERLRDRIGHYLFISTISVYRLGRAPIDEDSPLLTVAPERLAKPSADDYGGLKALAERAAEEAMPGRATSLRAGVIVGAGDPSGRFVYWPRRLERGGDVLVPTGADGRMQFIDVRDLAQFTVRALEDRAFGIFNVVGPADPALGSVLGAIDGAVGHSAHLVYADRAWMNARDAGGWDDFPLVVANDDDQAGFGHVSAARALARGLTFHPVADTATSALAWWKENGRPPGPGISPEREAELLSRWRSR